MEWFINLLKMVTNITDLTQKLNIQDKAQTLKRKMETLANKEADISAQLDIEERRPGKKRKQEVKDWSKNFERLSCEVNDVEQKVATSTSLWQLMLGSYLDKLIREVEQLHEQGRFFEGLTLDGEETQGCELPVGQLVGQAFRSNQEKLWEYLMSEDVQSIGVQGMGGVGKTSLVMHIHNQIVKDQATFKSSCWVTVSQDCSIRKLQDAIAEHFHLELKNKNDETIRAGKLWKALSSRKFVIILDDIWQYYSLEKIGIPLGRNGCKLILTSRKNDVCHQMNCDKIIEVAILPEREAWCLFRDNLTHGSLLSPNVEEIAQAVARECAGLPLGIMVLSGIMRGVNDIHEWRNTLKELRESKFKEERMEDEVFTVLQFSYQRLIDSVKQQCFLHMALYPEDYEFNRQELIQYFIHSELIEGEGTRKAEFDKGNAILNKLVNSCLLGEDITFPSTIKMHDLVRDMAINITNKHFLVKAGQRLREIPNGKEWVGSLEKVSLMYNDIKDIESDVSPRCLNISTLLLQHNPLVSIPNSFFKHMQTLQFLNLSFTSIKELPNSFSELENLKALHLIDCIELRSVPSLAKMRALRTLDLLGSGIEEVPQGMERLRSLTYLNLAKTERLLEAQFPIEILPQLSHLQCLIVLGGPVLMKAEELISLTKLECLYCGFEDAHEFSNCMSYLQSRTPHLDDWHIVLGHGFSSSTNTKIVRICNCSLEGRGESLRIPEDVGSLHLEICQGVISMSQWGNTFSELKECFIYKCKGMEMVINDSEQFDIFPKLRKLSLSNLRDLRVMISSSLQPTMTPSNGGFFSNLTYLEICSCPKIKKLLKPSLLPLLTHVEQVIIINCDELEEIIAIEDGDHDDPTLVLPKLTNMRLQKLPQLNSLCGEKWTMKFDSLRSLVICNCPKLERIPMELHIPPDDNPQASPVPSSLNKVFILSVPGWRDTKWMKIKDEELAVR